MGYDYLLTLFKLLLGLVTSRRLIYIALISFGLYLLWVILALVFSFQRRFYTKSLKMYNYLKKSNDITDKRNFVDGFASRISAGFGYGWKRFSNSKNGKPSKFISRKESLDSEVNGGVFNQGKSIMKFYIWLTTILLLTFNLAYHGGEQVVTFLVFAECAMFPVIYFVILKIFYFLYTIVRQQLYKLDIDVFYDLVLELDKNFGTDDKPNLDGDSANYGEASDGELLARSSEMQEQAEQTESETSAEEVTQSADADESQEDIVYTNSVTNSTESDESAEQNQEEQSEPETEAELENELDKYDVFKKKNIDVSNLINEVPSSAKTLPYINVDSSYVISDESAEKDEAASSKKSTNSDNDGITEQVSDENTNESAANDDVIKTDIYESQESTESESLENSQTDEAESEEPEIENASDEQTNDAAFEENTPEEEDTEVQENLGLGVVEEENTAAEEEPAPQEENIEDESAAEEEAQSTEDDFVQPDGKFEINTQPTINLDEFEINTAEEVANTASANSSLAKNKSAEDGKQKSNFVLPGESAEEEDSPKIERRRPQSIASENQEAEAASEPEITKRKVKAKTEKKNTDKKEKKSEKKPEKKAEKVKTAQPIKKDNGEKTMTSNAEESTAKKRGRPKKQIFDENVSITSDAEFDEVLSRAEKLMRKSEEGLSASQSKRIEKELKMLIDAMNKYKENK